MTWGKSLNLCLHAHHPSLNKRIAQFHPHTLLKSPQTKSFCSGWKALNTRSSQSKHIYHFITTSNLRGHNLDVNKPAENTAFVPVHLFKWCKICSCSALIFWSKHAVSSCSNNRSCGHLMTLSYFCDSSPGLSLNFCERDCCKPMRATDSPECSIMAQSLSHSLKDCLNGLVYYWPREAKGFCQHLGEGITAS